jgi:hypothetical protein
MNKYIRILEVPLYLLVLSLFCFDYEAIGIGLFLLVMSVARLIVNSITDDTIYKEKKNGPR